MDKKKKPKIKRKVAKQDYNLEGIPSSSLKMKYYKRKRQQKRLRTKIFQVHLFVKILAIFAMFYLCSRLMICKYWYLPQNVFDAYPNTHIKLIGNKITPDEKIIQALKLHPIPNMPIYLVDTAPYEDEVENLCTIKKAFVRRYWLPTRFEVTVEEEIPVLSIAPSPSAPEIAALTRKGKIISQDYLPINNPNYRTYKILTYEDFQQWSTDEIFQLNILAQRIEDYAGEKLLYLDIRQKNDIFAQLETIKIRIGEMNSTLKQRIERLNSIMPRMTDLKRKTDYIDLRWDNTTYLKEKTKEQMILEDKIKRQKIEAEIQLKKLEQQKLKAKQNKENAVRKEKSISKKTEPAKKNIPQKPIKNANKPLQGEKTLSQEIKQTPAKQPVVQEKKTTETTNNANEILQELPDIKIEIVEP